MYAVNVRAMEGFLTQMVEGGDFTDVAMRDDLRFVGPLASATGAEEYRSICRGFAEVVRGIWVRTMVGDGDVVHVVYDVDMGLESGPLPTSQTVEFIDGAFAVVHVIFDAAAIAGVAS